MNVVDERMQVLLGCIFSNNLDPKIFLVTHRSLSIPNTVILFFGEFLYFEINMRSQKSKLRNMSQWIKSYAIKDDLSQKLTECIEHQF